ncbi:MAG: hypothetical protein GX418_11385 [Clostridiales bacterium]|nr:hypothetical protein [Clostridiales bacterium]
MPINKVPMKNFDEFLVETQTTREKINITIQGISAEIVAKYGETPTNELRLAAIVEFLMRSMKSTQQEELRIYHEWLIKQLD